MWDTNNYIKRSILRGIYAFGFETPSPIQKKAIVPMITVDSNGGRRDIIAQAQSGTGKTGAFSVGTLQVVDETLNKTQAIILSRYAWYGQGIQQAISAPRWLLGRTWGSEVTNVRIENRFRVEILDQLASVGHELEVIGSYDDIMGHAGAIVLHPDGRIEGASDPRSDGSVAVV